MRALVRFASATLGKSAPPAYERRPKPVKIKEPSRPQPLRYAGIKRGHQAANRRTFEVMASQGRLKRPVIHVELATPKNVKECLMCEAPDCLYVFVGLCNVFLIQFVLVVLVFFVSD